MLAGCAAWPGVERTSIKAVTFSELERQLASRLPALDQYKLRGPFEVVRQDDQEIRLGTLRLTGDLFFASHGGRAPLVIIVHGYGATKAMHASQALHMASWGLHVLTVQVRNTGPWVDNGRILRELVTAIARHRVLTDPRIDSSRLILAGHSFGAASVAVALAEGAPAMGGIFLDPATTDRAVPLLLSRNRMPLMIVGADDKITHTVNRAYFYNYARSKVFEVSIKDATHDDAQFPADSGSATLPMQQMFAGAMTVAALSLDLTGGFDYAWSSFADDVKSGRLIQPRKK